MSRLISDILGAPEPHFSHTLRQWEQLTGHNGHDVRLISDIVHARKAALHALELDYNDTTPKELYFALRHKAVQTNTELEIEVGVRDTDTPETVMKKIVSFIDTLPISRDTWTVKHSVVKQLLRTSPPKKTLRALGLRSIDSVLKRMNSNELLAMAHQLESADWSKKMHGAVKKLKPTDFDTSTSQLCVVDSTRANKLHTAGIRTSKIFIPSYETGIIVIVPPKQRFALDTLALTLALLELLYDLRVYSAYFRLVSVNGNFGAKVHQVLHSGLANLPEHNEVSWKVLQRHFNHHEQSFEPVAQPHFQHEDVLVEAPLQTLSEVLPSGPFWNENSYIFMTDNDTPVSLHLLDVITNTSNHVPLESGVDMHMRRQLWEELGLRYLNHESMRNEAIRKYTEL